VSQESVIITLRMKCESVCKFVLVTLLWGLIEYITSVKRHHLDSRTTCFRNSVDTDVNICPEGNSSDSTFLQEDIHVLCHEVYILPP
jgi:hypothetical protein